MTGGHQFEIDRMKDRKQPLKPIWVGVGCILLSLLMGAGYLIAGWLMDANNEAHWIRIPGELAWPPDEPYLLLKLLLAFVFLLFSMAAITLVYALIHPDKPGRFDVRDPSIFPPPPRQRKR